MGLFLTHLALKINSKDEVINSVINIMKDEGLELGSKQKAVHPSGLDNEFFFTDAKKEWVQIFCPEKQDESIALKLSKRLNIPVFQFHIHDGDFWMYKLFISGSLKDKFSALPEYYKEISLQEKENWRGDSKILSEVFKVRESKIAPYLIFWDEDKKKSIKKAFPKDQYIIASEWGMIDFQKKFGIIYPDFEKNNNPTLIKLTFQSGKFRKIKSLFKNENK